MTLLSLLALLVQEYKCKLSTGSVLIGKLLGHSDFVTCVAFAPESWKVRSLLALLVQKYLLYW